MKIPVVSLVLFLSLFLPNTTYGFYSSTAHATGKISVLQATFTLSLHMDGWQIKETLTNGDFESDLDAWFTSGDVEVVSAEGEVAPVSGNRLVRLGAAKSPYGTHRLMGILPKGAKNLSFFYRLATRDHSPFDNPTFLVRINGQTVYQTNTIEANPGSLPDDQLRISSWRKLEFDLTAFEAEYVNLELVVSNNGDSLRPSWVYLDNFTTDFAIGNSQSKLEITGDNPGTDLYKYQIDTDPWQTGDNFFINDEGDHQIKFQAINEVGFASDVLEKSVRIDNQSPYLIDDLLVDWVGPNFVDLSWRGLSPNDTQIFTQFYWQKDCSSSAAFEPALNHPYDYLNPTGQAGKIEQARVYGLEPNTSYCFSVKINDQVPNTSDWSNISQATTSPSSVPIQPGDLIINELMWMGSSSFGSSDEWLELHNVTDRTLDLSQISFTKLGSGGEANMNPDLSGKSIAPYGYYLISRADPDNSSLSQNPNLTFSSLTLNNSSLQIKLLNNGLLLDTAGNGDKPISGIYNSAKGHYFSMARAFSFSPIPELNWFSTLDPASSVTYFDLGAVERGTPNARNH